MRDQTATIEAGFVHLPERAHWLADLLQELAAFPKGKHDDQMDSMSQALCWISTQSTGDGYYQGLRKSMQLRAGEIEGAVIMRSPVHYTMDLLGVDEIPGTDRYNVAPEDIDRYLAKGWTLEPGYEQYEDDDEDED